MEEFKELWALVLVDTRLFDMSRVVPLTGGKGSITQWVHAEYMEGSKTICSPFTQQVRGGYPFKVPTKVPTG